MKILDDQLCADDGTPVTFRRSVNQGRAGQEVVIAPTLLVMHFTAGNGLDGAVTWFCDPAAQASAHIVIGRDGAVVQCVKFNRRAWHAGSGSWRGRSDINSWSIGIEMVNWGKLKRVGNTWRTWTQAPYAGHVGDPNTDVLEAPHRNAPDEGILGWPTYTEAQVAKAIEVAQLIIQRYGIVEVIGHEDFRTDKTDPGPAFPLASFRSRVLGRDEGSIQFMITTDIVNIRTGPGTTNAKLPESPLSKDQTVQVRSANGDWRFVDVTLASGQQVTGWVHANYLKPLA
ncbi:MAG: N-acetylmuramoyl-L-alanine amidase [Reyranellaceae bacterium]